MRQRNVENHRKCLSPESCYYFAVHLATQLHTIRRTRLGKKRHQGNAFCLITSHFFLGGQKRIKSSGINVLFLRKHEVACLWILISVYIVIYIHGVLCDASMSRLKPIYPQDADSILERARHQLVANFEITNPSKISNVAIKKVWKIVVWYGLASILENYRLLMGASKRTGLRKHECSR